MLITTALLATLSISAPALEWHQGSLDSAIAKSKAHDAPTVLYFWRNGSEYCAKYYQETLADERITEALSGTVLLSAQHGTDDGNALFERFGVSSLPSLVFVQPDGTIDDMIAGYAEADTLINELERVLKGEFTISDLEKRLAASEEGGEEHFEWRYRLATKARDFGNGDAWLAGIESIRKDDKRGTTLHGARAHIDAVYADITADEEGAEYVEGEERTYDAKPLLKLARKLKNAEGQFEAWDRAATLQAYSKDVAGACRSWTAALEIVPEKRAKNWASATAGWLIQSEGERTSKEKKLALDLAKMAAELASTTTPCGADEENCECAAPEKDYAAHLARLARAYDFAGEAELAKATASKALELDPSDECREKVGELL